MNRSRVFLGGTCNPTQDRTDEVGNWRDHIIPLLKIDYFNPVVSNWNEDAQKREDCEKITCNTHLYVITSRQIGWYSFIEMVLSAVSGKRTLVAFFKPDEFPKHHQNSLRKIQSDLSHYTNAQVILTDSLDEIATRLNVI